MTLREKIGAILREQRVTVVAVLAAIGPVILADLNQIQGILGSIISWIFRVAANVVGFLAENLFLLLLAAADMIMSVVNKFNQKRGGHIRAKKH